ncbi:hypothetical protein GCM10023322_18870 [Rugosimonospora acidiphila]|uniref:Secreted protein n=1 Tax=Rugosimonospora acidiphila TaxID=556531 RepID=A0ABP9RP33_9ACTN
MLLLIVLGGGLATALLITHQKHADSTVRADGPDVPSGPVYHKLPACDGLGTAMPSLIPKGEKTEDSQDSGSDFFQSTECDWDNIDADDTNPPGVRGTEIHAQAYNNEFEAAVQTAKDAFDETRSEANDQAGKTDSADHAYGPVTTPSGLGDEATAQDYTVHEDVFPANGTRIDMRVNNVLVELNYEGFDGADTDLKPMAADQANKGAQTIARAVVAWLKGCADCQS